MKAPFPLLVVAQLSGVVATFGAMALWPPTHGAMLMVPLRASAAETIDAAVAGQAAVLGRGPLGGSIVVDGDRAHLLAAIGRRSIMLLAAPPAVCGGIGPS